MALFHLFLGLLIQSSFIFCEDGKVLTATDEAHTESAKETLPIQPIEFDHDLKHDFFATFFGPTGFYPTPSLDMMTQVQDSNASPEEQIEEIKKVATKISENIKLDLANLMTYALDCLKYKHDHKHDHHDHVHEHEHKLKHEDPEQKSGEVVAELNEVREKRSAETPMDSTKLIMRLLKHIKSNNEYQNIAIDKMMTAQEIADKFGIDFNPDAEILTDLAVAANTQTQDLTDILKNACDSKNQTVEVEFVPLQDNPTAKPQNVSDKNNYYTYSVNQPEPARAMGPQNFVNIQEFAPEQVRRPAANHHHNPQQHPQHHHHVETQVMPPPVHAHPKHHHPSPPVSPRPNFFEPPSAYTPMPEFYPQFCPEFEPFPAIIVEEIYEPEPELVAEEIEETVSSKVLVDHETPGEATVNHVMTYTVTEKAHFRTPQIEKLPEQMQYCFLLM